MFSIGEKNISDKNIRLMKTDEKLNEYFKLIRSFLKKALSIIDSGKAQTKKEKIIQKLSINPLFNHLFTTNRSSSYYRFNIEEDSKEDLQIKPTGKLFSN
jgi:hypothetical protein